MGVNRGGLEAAVTEQDLDRAEIGAGFQEMGGEAVAQRLNTLLIPRLR